MNANNQRCVARGKTCAAAASSSSSSPSSSTSVAMLVKLDSDPKKMLSLARGVTGMLPLELAKLARERELARESAWAESEGRGVGCARRSIVLRASLRRSRELLTPIICIAEPARLRTAPFWAAQAGMQARLAQDTTTSAYSGHLVAEHQHRNQCGADHL